jgi:hypothetical protein
VLRGRSKRTHMPAQQFSLFVFSPVFVRRARITVTSVGKVIERNEVNEGFFSTLVTKRGILWLYKNTRRKVL